MCYTLLSLVGLHPERAPLPVVHGGVHAAHEVPGLRGERAGELQLQDVVVPGDLGPGLPQDPGNRVCQLQQAAAE